MVAVSVLKVSQPCQLLGILTVPLAKVEKMKGELERSFGWMYHHQDLVMGM